MTVQEWRTQSGGPSARPTVVESKKRVCVSCSWVICLKGNHV